VWRLVFSKLREQHAAAYTAQSGDGAAVAARADEVRRSQNLTTV